MASRLRAIEAIVTKLAEKPDSFWTTVFAVIVGGLISGLVTLYAQHRSINAQTRLAEATAREAISKSVVDWRIRQLSALYGPLHALLDQSIAMYRLMNVVLEKAEPAKYRLRDDSSSADLDKKVFEIQMEGSWTRFRTVTHIREVYGKGLGVEGYFDDVVGIGEQLKEVISKNAGYVRQDQPELSKVLGRYLAHFAVLSRVHTHVKHAETQHAGQPGISVLEAAAFPSEIQRLVADGVALINSDIRAWDVRASV